MPEGNCLNECLNASCGTTSVSTPRLIPHQYRGEGREGDAVGQVTRTPGGIPAVLPTIASVLDAAADLLHHGKVTTNQLHTEEILTSLAAHSIVHRWQLLELSSDEWQQVVPNVSIGMRAAIKVALRAASHPSASYEYRLTGQTGPAGPLTSAPSRPSTTERSTSPMSVHPPVDQQVFSHYEKAKTLFANTPVWVNVEERWVQRLACSGQSPDELRSAIVVWTQGYSIQWLLFFATVAPVMFNVSRPIGSMPTSPSTGNATHLADINNDTRGDMAVNSEINWFWLDLIYLLWSVVLIGFMWTGMFITMYTEQIVNSLAAANFSVALVTVITPFLNKILSLNGMISFMMGIWLHMTIQITCFADDAPTWAMVTVHVFGLMWECMFSWGGMIYFGFNKEHGGLWTQLMVHGGLLDEAKLPFDPVGKTKKQMIDSLSEVAVWAADGKKVYGGPEWVYQSFGSSDNGGDSSSNRSSEGGGGKGELAFKTRAKTSKTLGKRRVMRGIPETVAQSAVQC